MQTHEFNTSNAALVAFIILEIENQSCHGKTPDTEYKGKVINGNQIQFSLVSSVSLFEWQARWVNETRLNRFNAVLAQLLKH